MPNIHRATHAYQDSLKWNIERPQTAFLDVHDLDMHDKKNSNEKEHSSDKDTRTFAKILAAKMKN